MERAASTWQTARPQLQDWFVLWLNHYGHPPRLSRRMRGSVRENGADLRRKEVVDHEGGAALGAQERLAARDEITQGDLDLREAHDP